MREVWHGDQLLRVDEQLDLALDGVYRKGDFYLRWLQVVSSLFFGNTNRSFCHVIPYHPFGGAVVIVEGAIHVIHTIQKGSKAQRKDSDSVSDSTSTPVSNQTDTIVTDATDSNADATAASKSKPLLLTADETETKEDNSKESNSDSEETTSVVAVPPKTTDQAVNQILNRQIDTLGVVLILGFLLMALIHLPSFRKFSLGLLKSAWSLTKRLLIDIPIRLFKLPFFRDLWDALPLVYFSGFVLVPGLLALFLGRWLPFLVGVKPLDWILGRCPVCDFEFTRELSIGARCSRTNTRLDCSVCTSSSVEICFRFNWLGGGFLSIVAKHLRTSTLCGR